MDDLKRVAIQGIYSETCKRLKELEKTKGSMRTKAKLYGIKWALEEILEIPHPPKDNTSLKGAL